jgi:hypothetical protein
MPWFRITALWALLPFHELSACAGEETPAAEFSKPELLVTVHGLCG